MPYSDLYIHASDFDWFIFGDKIKIHAASAGGEVPLSSTYKCNFLGADNKQ